MLCTAHWTHALAKSNKSLKGFRLVRDAKQWLKDNTPFHLQPPWSITHVRHPCTIWTAENTGNYEWHIMLMRALLDEYTLRYKRNHKSEEVYDWLIRNTPQQMVHAPKTAHPQCMPDPCKVPGNAVSAYRNYYNAYKGHMAKWRYSQVPQWWNPHLGVQHEKAMK